MYGTKAYAYEIDRVMYMAKYYHILVMFLHIFNSMVFWRCFVLNWPFLSSNRMFFNIQSYKSCDARKGKVMAIYVHYFFQFWFRFYNYLSLICHSLQRGYCTRILVLLWKCIWIKMIYNICIGLGYKYNFIDRRS